MIKLIIGFFKCKFKHEHTLQISKELKYKLNGINTMRIYYTCKFCGKSDSIKGEVKNTYHEI
jgi:hypothetical protein